MGDEGVGGGQLAVHGCQNSARGAADLLNLPFYSVRAYVRALVRAALDRWKPMTCGGKALDHMTSTLPPLRVSGSARNPRC